MPQKSPSMEEKFKRCHPVPVASHFLFMSTVSWKHSEHTRMKSHPAYSSLVYILYK